MKLHQLSVFLENKPGQLKAVCKALADANLNIRTMTLADTKEFGIVRIILREWEQAQFVLQEAGFVATCSEVLALEVMDQPGGLAEVLNTIDDAKLNVEYMYAFTFGRDDKAVLIFRFDNADVALERLKERGINVVSSIELT
ncbi:MAG TPA: ACT domain-containing protein [Aggregatilineaceae bacterium]|nr:ACT domain-containing protein [Aggregatilineaceae bacterium]